MSTKPIQMLVDEHAFLGMNHQEIKAHLIKSHGIPKTSKIPPISKKAIKDGRIFLDTGKIPKWISGVITTKNDSMVNVETTKISDSYLVDRLNSGQIEFTDYSKTEDELDQMQSCYQDGFPTSLDRWFYTYLDMNCGNSEHFEQLKSIVSDMGTLQKNPSKYQATEGFLKILSQHTNEGSIAYLFASERLAANIDPIFISNWFVGQKTYNIQIDSSTAHELLVSDEASRRNDWVSCARSTPVFIDITSGQKGQRYISGIASVPLDNGSIRFMAIVEWKGIDFQGIIQWEDENLADDSVVISLYGDSVYDESITDREYGEVAAISLRLYKSALNLRELEILTQSSKIPRATPDAKQNPKKKRKPKTHTIFNFGVLNIKSDLSIYNNTDTNRKAWSLNHIIGVRGHFRAQYYGPESKNKKIIWINPYTKGVGEVESKLDKDIIRRISTKK